MKKKKEKSDSGLDKVVAILKETQSPKEITTALMQAMELDIHEALTKRYEPKAQLMPFINVVSADINNDYNKEQFVESLSTTHTLDISSLPEGSDEKIKMFYKIGEDYNQNFPSRLPVIIYFVSEVYAKIIPLPEGSSENPLLQEKLNLKTDKAAKEAIMIAGLSVDKQLRVSIIPLEEISSDTDFSWYEAQVFDLTSMAEAGKAGFPMLSAFFNGVSMGIHGDEKNKIDVKNLSNFLKMSIN